MNAQVFEQFDVMDKETLSTVEGGSSSCLTSAAASLALGAAAIGASTVPVAGLYLGAQALATGANAYYCLK